MPAQGVRMSANNYLVTVIAVALVVGPWLACAVSLRAASEQRRSFAGDLHVGAGAGSSAGAENGNGALDSAHMSTNSRLGSSEASDSSYGKTFNAAVDDVLDAMLGLDSSKGAPLLGPLLTSSVEKLDLETAVQVAHASPEVLAALPLQHRGNTSQRKLDIPQIEKAVGDLNELALKAQARLDKKIFDCKQFEEKSQRTLAQVSGDLARLGQTLGNSQRVMLTSMNKIQEIEGQIQSVKEEQERSAMSYKEKTAAAKQLLAQRQSDLKKMEYMLDMTKCQDGPSCGAGLLEREAVLDREAGASAGAGAGAGAGSLQAADNASSASLGGAASYGFHACFDEARPGPSQVGFDNPLLESEARQLSDEAQEKLRVALAHSALMEASAGEGATQAQDIASRLGLARELYDVDDELESFVTVGGHGGQTPQATTPAPASTGTEKKQANRCIQAIGTDGKVQPDCGVLHDTFAALWGEMRDLVEETTARIYKEAEQFESLNNGIKAQLQALTSSLGTLQSSLAEVTAQKASETNEQSMKLAEETKLKELDKSTMKDCKDTIRYLIFTEMCGLIKVRNELISVNMKSVDVSKVQDCQVSEWVYGACSKTCDDELKGGTQVVERSILSQNSSYGMQCPPLTFTRACNQVKCPVDCKLSEWSQFSKCTKECGGGIQTRSRSKEVKPKNGGSPCSSLQETRPCNSDPCDRPCQLGDWTAFTSCTKVCGKGVMERQKPIVVKARGSETCPRKTSLKRYESKDCNVQSCVGDEVCISKMDLVIALDSSGSLTQEGFDILKVFAAKMVRRLRPTAYNREALRVSVVQFGQGKLCNKIVSDAVIASPATDDMEKAAKAIEELKWQKGFTNMAQAVIKAKDVIRTSSRKSAANVVMMITDGRPSFKRQTKQVVQDLRNSARLVIVQVQENRKVEIQRFLKGLVSKPVEANYIHVPGKKDLKMDYDNFVTQVLTQVCPRSESPSGVAATDKTRGFAKTHEDKTCGGASAGVTQATLEDCYGFAKAKAAKTFSFSGPGSGAMGQCEVFSDVACGGNFTRSAGFDVYNLTQPMALMG